ncbi:oligosaccharide flippase family protein [Uliginosibacterium sp. H3]|uniref:Oligosaccharide flippase family protein n=1 Tax=Uliginosibacterium silvisoli TaxID=3114758 RepID=A0ABU6K2B8_9RHOO|nr:oligosaccharide flippase family protein [Uliginosibacterium sp. H3]
MASLKKSVAANMLGQLYVAAIGIVMVPVYVRHMGIEAYGLISFFVALQTWFALLDMGISPTLIRELSRYRAGAVSQEAVWRFIRSAEWLFLVVGAVCALILVLASSWIAGHWLQLTEISVAEASRCVAMMGVMVGGRWLTSLYRSGLIGMDRLLTVNLVAVLLATLRSVLVVAVLLLISTRCEVFFAYQVVIAVLEFSVCSVLFYRSLPGGKQSALRPDRSALPVFRFAGAMAGLTLAWGVIGQVDRLVLSHYLDLRAYGSYAVALVAASGVTLLSTPLIQALQPRLVFLATSHDEGALANLYRSGTQMLMCVLGVVSGAAIFLGEPLLWAWTGNRTLAHQEATILALYAGGNALLAMSSLVFQLQYARGEIRRHVVGSLIFSLLWVPSVVFLAVHYGATGAAWAWFVGNLAFFVGWMLETQRRMLPGLTGSWLRGDVLRGPAACLSIYALLACLVDAEHGRLASALFACGAAVLVVPIGIWVSPSLRAQAVAYVSGVVCRNRSA